MRKIKITLVGLLASSVALVPIAAYADSDTEAALWQRLEVLSKAWQELSEDNVELTEENESLYIRLDVLAEDNADLKAKNQRLRAKIRRLKNR